MPSLLGSASRVVTAVLQVHLIDSKRSMNVSIFLRQFGDDSTAVVDWLRDGDSSRLSAESLRALLRIIPDPHDVHVLTSYIESDRSETTRLAAAERFYVQLISLPKYVIRQVICVDERLLYQNNVMIDS